MRLRWFLVIFVVFCKKEVFSRGSMGKTLQTAFKDIAAALARQNHLLTFVAAGAKKDKFDTARIANFPHILVRPNV